MLAYALAIAVGLSGLVLFSTAFFMSDIHRQDDFFWSAISLFYALVLWFCATRITGGVLLGQAAAVALLVSYNWQTLKLRKAIAYPDRAAELNNFSILAAAYQLLNRGKSKPQAKVSRTPPVVTEQEIAIPDTTSTETPATDATTEITEAIADREAPVTDRPGANPNLASPKEAKKTGFFGKFLGGKNQESASTTSKADTSSVANTNLNDILDDAVVVETSTPLASLKETTTKKKTETTETSESVAQQPSKADEALKTDEVTTTSELADTVATETVSTSESMATETSGSKPKEISVTETTTVISSDDQEESVVEAVVIETSESETEAATTPESSVSQATSEGDKSGEELEGQNDKPTNS